MGEVRVGTSGYVYDHWKGRYYPGDLPRAGWFARYASEFGAAEINNTYYRLPSESVVARWRDAAPEGFVYAFKASRYVTHMKRLLPGGRYERPVETLVERLAPLKEKLGPILFQLPAAFHKDAPRLRAFLRRLPQGRARFAFEFRHPSWHDGEVFDLLGEHGVALCVHDFDGMETPRVATADLVYLRFHGIDGPYRGHYTGRRLRPWVDRIRAWARRGDVHAYFNNDEKAYATRDARWLAERAGAAGVPRRAEGGRAARARERP